MSRLTLCTLFLLTSVLPAVVAAPASTGALKDAAALAPVDVPIPGRESMVRLGAVPDPVTEQGRAIAETLLQGLNQQDAAAVQRAVDQLAAVQASENVGGNYSALQLLATTWLAEHSQSNPAARPAGGLDRAYVDFFLDDAAAHLKEYLWRKYDLGDEQITDPEAHVERRTFLEDYLIFNNPARDSWDASAQVVAAVAGLASEVRTLIDVGAGFGYFSYRFAQALGKDATVYAVDTQRAYVETLQQTLQRYQIGGIRPLVSTPQDVSVTAPTDLVFISSLYHVLYVWSQPRERDVFMASIARSLRDGGYLVILDNRDHAGESLHNSFLNSGLAIAQLYFYGYELVSEQALSPYRYLLVLRKAGDRAAQRPRFAVQEGQSLLRLSGSDSAVHIGSLDSFDITPAGVAAARLLLSALMDKDLEAARAAISLYQAIIPTENFGGEYSALQWVAEYLVGDPAQRAALTADPLSAEFLAYLAADDFAKLKLFLAKKYKIEAPGIDERLAGVSVPDATDEKNREVGIVRRRALEDFILFNNPRRERWEASSRFLALLGLKPGDRVVDIGSGPGYFSFKFADRVGPDGRVFALDTNEGHIEYLKTLQAKWGVSQLVPMLSQTDGFTLPEPGTADLVFMCSLYHVIYAVSSRAEREGMIASILAALAPDGRFVVVDNGPVDGETLPYHGPYIRKELIIAQLAAFGFELEREVQVIPQRYLLSFRRAAPGS